MEGGDLHKRSILSLNLNRVSEFAGVIGGYATVLMVILVTVNVLTRALANKPILGFYDMVGLLGIIFYAFGIVFAAVRKQHIVMSIVLVRLPQRAQKICGLVNRLIVIIFCLLLAYAGGTFGWELWQNGKMTNDIAIPVAPFQFIIVAAILLLCILVLAGKEITRGGE